MNRHEPLVSVDVCIATYKRPQFLKKNLLSLHNQKLTKNVRLSVIVVDNDEDGSAAGVVQEILRSTTLAVIYAVEPEKNIALARNASLGLSHSDYILFIDDDEIADDTWVSDHLKALKQWDADVLTGPVVPLYPADTPAWIVKGDFYRRPTLPNGHILKTAYTANTSVKRTALDNAGSRFNADYGITGGSDSEFFARLNNSGAKIVHSHSPKVFEHALTERMNAKWLLRRGFRLGQGRTRIRKKLYNDYNPLIGGTTNAFAIIYFGLQTVILFGFGKQYFMKPCIRVAMHAGMLSALISQRYFREYK